MEEWQTARAAPPSAGEAVCMHERRRDQSSQRGAQVFGAVVVIPGMGMPKRHREDRKRDCQKRQQEALSLRPRWFAPAAARVCMGVASIAASAQRLKPKSSANCASAFAHCTTGSSVSIQRGAAENPLLPVA